MPVFFYGAAAEDNGFVRVSKGLLPHYSGVVDGMNPGFQGGVGEIQDGCGMVQEWRRQAHSRVLVRAMPPQHDLHGLE